MTGVRVRDDEVVFPSGKVRYANNGIIGLSPRSADGDWEISEGYDGTLWHSQEGHWGTDPLSGDDLRALADYMIGLWRQFRDDAPA